MLAEERYHCLKEHCSWVTQHLVCKILYRRDSCQAELWAFKSITCYLRYSWTKIWCLHVQVIREGQFSRLWIADYFVKVSYYRSPTWIKSSLPGPSVILSRIYRLKILQHLKQAVFPLRLPFPNYSNWNQTSVVFGPPISVFYTVPSIPLRTTFNAWTLPFINLDLR